MPSGNKMHMNPNDGVSESGFAMKKKQFNHLNQHYISHNVVLPSFDMAEQMREFAEGYTGSRPS